MYLLSEPSHLKPLRQGCKIVQDKMLTLLQGTKKKKYKNDFYQKNFGDGKTLHGDVLLNEVIHLIFKQYFISKH